MSLPELWLLVQAPLLLPVAAVALRRWGLNRVLATVTGARARARPASSPGQRLTAAKRLGWCVQVAAAYGPWPANCLQRSVVLCWFLRRRGLDGELRIGVRRTDGETLDFHAWVEYDGAVINDKEDVQQRYAVFAGPIVPPGARFT